MSPVLPSSAPVVLRRLARLAALLSTLAFTTACVPVRDVDARFAAGWRPTRGYCAFGAETPRLAAWCADVNFGADGLLVLGRAVNSEVLASSPGRRLPCDEHVAEARRRLAQYPDYAVREVYSCDAEPVLEDGRPVCHVSLLVTSVSGLRVVLDNGHVLDPATTNGVASYAQFAEAVDRHWVAASPTAVPTVSARR